eukprot:CAMPEP_0197632298 /NCGR_PEP_ID=MMETSP1338-20131121/9115_1 /TAXON_ID=43686 ORGANISM="Pelagodinium beii, Strain RCC1491" /NCGR_SAMPLE_ID=MMETSP1338 /ASSEMBLY_ACC=CAM_ASM_000754 /LENGTH=503 /DNA_ID=CAMNT_0043203857 /DNA_START=53 /DNA_END=1560 /DNA_ORIENTATION=+
MRKSHLTILALLVLQVPGSRPLREQLHLEEHAEQSLRTTVEAFSPEPGFLNGLEIARGDRVRVTHDPQHPRHAAYRGEDDGYVYGFNQKSSKHGWFPLSNTAVVAAALLQAGPGQCLNTYFSDWGSSGMKLYKVHVGVEDFQHDTTKDQGLLSTCTEADFEQRLDGHAEELLATGKVAHNAWRIFATAGHRIDDVEAEQLWRHLQDDMSWNRPMLGLLADCDFLSHDGCRTLPGSTEAYYEFSAAFMDGRNEEKEKPRGFLSAGGASLQIGVANVNKVKMTNCQVRMQKLYDTEAKKNVPEYDAQPVGRTKLPGGENVFLASFLAIDGELASCRGNKNFECNHRVGGVNEMRKQFEHFLERMGYHSNPCLEKVAPIPLAYGSAIFSKRLPGSYQGGGLEACTEAVEDFMSKESSLIAWQEGKCDSMVRPIKKWIFMTAFSRISERIIKNKDVEQDACNDSNKDQPFRCGGILTDKLLASFLEKIGFDMADEIVESHADWASAP